MNNKVKFREVFVVKKMIFVFYHFLFVMGGGGSLLLGMLFLNSLIHFYFNENGLRKYYDVKTQILHFSAGTLFAALLIFLGSMMLIKTALLYRLITLKIICLNDGVEIRTKSGGYFICYADMKYIFGERNTITLVWRFGSDVLTLKLEKNMFGDETLRRMTMVFSQMNVFTQDSKEIRKTCKRLKLNDVFRSNHFENQIGKLLKNA